MQRQRALWREEEQANSGRRRPIPRASNPSSQRISCPSLRHSVVSTVQDCSIAALYPVEDNYVVDENVESARRSPKSLALLCTEAVCRSLAHLNGELPPGLPLDVVDDIVESLVRHSALNPTTLRVLKNCELGSLRLAGARGVTDAWLEPFSHTSIEMPSHPDILDCMDLEGYGIFDARDDAKSTASSRSTSSFVSATSKLDEIDTEHCKHHDNVSLAATTATPMEDMMTLDDTMVPPAYSIAYFHGSATANMTLLDLRGSQRLTDKGLLQLSNLASLAVAKLGDCHNLSGRGLLAFSMSHRLHTLSLTNCRRLTDEAIINVSHLVALEALSLDGCRCLTDRSLQAIASLYCLRRLDLSQCDLLSDQGLEHLVGIESLEELSLGWCRSITNKGLDILTSQPGRSLMLRILRLSRCMITGEGMNFLGRLSALVELDMNGCSGVGSSALGRALERMLNLESLDVSYCPGILRTSWQGKIPKLKSLDVCYSGVKDTHLSELVDLPALEHLNVDSCPVGDWAIAHLADNNVIPNLKSLDLADTDLTDLGASHLVKFRNLTRLSLFYCNITNQGLRHISELSQLEVLNLDSREISDSGLFHLRNLQRLRSLDLFSGRITDSGCAHLARIKALESLELCGGGVGDLGCSLISGLHKLTSLNLSQNERITNRGAKALGSLKNLKALNLSNTGVDATNLSLPKSLQSLALYGVRGIDDGHGMSLLQSDLPSLKCLRLNKQQNEDGMMVGVSVDEADAFDALDPYISRLPGQPVAVVNHDPLAQGRGNHDNYSTEANSMMDEDGNGSVYSDHN